MSTPSKPVPPKFGRSEYFVAFGPNDTLCCTLPNDITYNTLQGSDDLNKIISESKSINAVVYPTPDGDPYLAYGRKGTVKTHHEVYTPAKGGLPELDAWLKDRWSSAGDLQVVSNADGGWWALTGGGTRTWQGLPQPMVQALKPTNPDGKAVHVALGIDGSYIILYENGHAQWDLRGQYPRLEQYLTAHTQGELIYAALDPFRAGRFFAAFFDSTVGFEFAESAADVSNALLNSQDLRVIIDSETVKHTGAMMKSNSAAKSAAWSFGTGVASNVIASAVSSSMGLQN